MAIEVRNISNHNREGELNDEQELSVGKVHVDNSLIYVDNVSVERDSVVKALSTRPALGSPGGLRTGANRFIYFKNALYL
jgi:hypothetical protein